MAETKIDTLSIDIDYSAGVASSGLQSLKTMLDNLNTSTSGSINGLKSTLTQLNKLNNIIQQLDSTKISTFSTNMKSVSSAVQPLTQLGKTNLGSFINQLKKIPDLNKALDSNTISKFTTKIKELSNAMIPLANNLTKVGNVLNSMPSKLNKVSNYTAKTQKATSGLSSLPKLLNFGAIFAGFQTGSRLLSGFIDNSNKYVEDLNLFNVAMGESAGRAKEWIDTVSEALGLDPANMMRYMGIFQMMRYWFWLIR